MSLFESVRMALASLSANKLRSFLTMLGVIIGVASVVGLVSIGQGASRSVTEQIASLGSDLITISPGRWQRGVPGAPAPTRGSVQILTLQHMLELRDAHLPGVRSVSAEMSGNLTVAWERESTSTSVVGTTPEYVEQLNWEVAQGRFLLPEEVEGVARVAVLGDVAAEDLFGDSGASPIGATIRIRDVPFTVVGVMTPRTQGFFSMGDRVLVPITTAQKRLFGRNTVGSIQVSSLGTEWTPLAEQALTNFMVQTLNSEEEFVLTSQQEILETVAQTTGTLTLLLAGITGISLLVGGIGIMNIMLVSVTERTREIGVRKALGAKSRHVLTQFLVESVTLSGLGGVVGVLVGAGAGWYLARAGQWALAVEPLTVGLALGFAVAVGLFFGVYPAFRAARLDPIEALRYE
ncbi:ABC transporter permease [Limnochorda pilosa]|uniref:Multidrug ABC transporter substrate-binding protein n=1 Tax=Limnochorda pilosa TaxID=1555112 RepID=A0A0K2SNP3_LIMPI|nr:ABC transporter permease [Limnochorda pilosa]BAS28716.1 multidrug ABC transporter substrate-binding protein [Limnochorda pilosa]